MWDYFSINKSFVFSAALWAWADNNKRKDERSKAIFKRMMEFVVHDDQPGFEGFLLDLDFNANVERTWLVATRAADELSKGKPVVNSNYCSVLKKICDAL